MVQFSGWTGFCQKAVRQGGGKFSLEEFFFFFHEANVVFYATTRSEHYPSILYLTPESVGGRRKKFFHYEAQ
jgi:hypothetical protein